MQIIEDMSEEDTAVVRTHQDNQQSISSMIEHHSNILDILKHALSSSIDIQRATSSFADGLGHSTLVGHMDDECVVFEASSGGANEDQSYTQDDAFKLIRILTSILVLKAYDLKNARFDTFVKYMTIIIQIIKWKITLSERYNWIQVFELLADFEQLLKEQDEIEGLLREENAGRVMVGEETVRIIFEAKQYGIDRSQASINDSSSTYIPLMMNNTDINICCYYILSVPNIHS
ncbi:hypothetical protein G6F56_001761 [Rhizopus delemar]|uniref:Uncharacterized protein n=1 Tax=Rhizopus stolonifer TaxID=4846 RepID=A0A367K3V3_RHIST|nr:hypothetical protein G6F56_001761 [Rhizopus delemar]RCH96894.1 hypothetical protein CU098_010205 [Rhizopus stolonifer]